MKSLMSGNIPADAIGLTAGGSGATSDNVDVNVLFEDSDDDGESTILPTQPRCSIDANSSFCAWPARSCLGVCLPCSPE